MSFNEQIVNGNFETGTFPPWIPSNAVITSAFSHSGIFAAQLAGGGVSSFIAQTVPASFGKLPYPVLFPIHPRTRRLIESVNIPFSNILFVEPTGYLEMLILTHNAGRVLTDSGGLQKEAYFLDVPCVTLRAQTEWPETLKNGCNVLVPIDEQEIMAKAAQPFRKKYVRHKNIFGDGKAAFKIIDALKTLS